MEKNKYLQNALKAFLPPEEVEIDEWAEKNIILPELTCPEPGPLRLSRTPYARGVLKAFHDPFIEWIVMVWGRQTSKSTIQHVCLCYAIACDPGSGLFLTPSEALSKYTSSNRLRPMFEACKAIMAKRTSNLDDYTVLEMKFVDMILSLAGGGSATQTMSRPVRYLFRDEIDEFKSGVGTDATDPLKSSEETTSNYANRKIVDSSTPTKTTGNVWRHMGDCQYIFELWVPCLHCGRFFVILVGEKEGEFWGNIDIHGETDPEAAATIADLKCFSCGNHMKNHQKPLLLDRAKWRARTSGDVLRQIMELVEPVYEETVSLFDVLGDPHTKKIGFHLPKWYSPFAHGTFGDCAREWMNAQGDFLKMSEWSKFWAARPYTEQAENTRIRETEKRVVNLAPGVCPDDTIAVSTGLDPGQRGFWWTSWAWLPHNRMHLVDYGHISLVGLHVEEIIELYRSFIFETRYPSADGTREFPIWRAGMDTGGGKTKQEPMTMTARAYQIVRGVANAQMRLEQSPNLRRLADKRFLATKGDTGSDKVMRESKLEKGPDGKIIPGGLTLWIMNVNLLKSAFSVAFNQTPGAPGSVTLHNGRVDEFIAHVTAEELQQNKKGGWEWIQKPRTENHLLDCTTNAWGVGNNECMGGVTALKGKPQRYPSTAAPKIEAKAIEPKETGVVIENISIPKAPIRQRGRRIISRGVE
jgi:phage terminase large subunit GpA-like protein